jgi:hypothetical protein
MAGQMSSPIEQDPSVMLMVRTCPLSSKEKCVMGRSELLYPCNESVTKVWDDTLLAIWQMRAAGRIGQTEAA